MKAFMQVTLIETGRPPAGLGGMFPGYPEMIASLLGGPGPDLSFARLALIDGEALPDPAACEAIVITGSAFGVYDATSWMEPLRNFIRGAFSARTPMVGVCFGHQIIADAMGGEVARSQKGWGVGRHVYTLVRQADWMTQAGAVVRLSASHQDQVIRPPQNAVTLAASPHTEHAILAYRDAPVISFQAHPEFSDAYAAALITARRGAQLSPQLADAALASLADPHDNALVASWIVNFLRSPSGV